MITLFEINKAIDDKIKGSLLDTEFSTITFVAGDVPKIIRPSLKVAIESGTNGKFNANCREKDLVCRVHFFASDRYNYKMENTKMQELIENAFLDDLEVKEGFFIPVEQVESEVSDTVLICSFDLYTVELLPDTDTSEIMETIEIN